MKTSNHEQKSENKRIIFNSFIYSLNEEEKTAKIIELTHISPSIYIPRSINHENQEYLITSISLQSYDCDSFLQFVEFADDSEIRTIEKDCFKKSYLQCLTIPSSVIDLREGWCTGTDRLTQVTVMPNNKRYLSVDGGFVIGKSKIESDVYDTFVFASRGAVVVNMPKYIRTIEPHAFYGCEELEMAIFTEDSELVSFGKDAFFHSKIESLTIPSSVEELKEGWCNGMNELIRVKVMANNKRYLSIDDKFIIGKSNIENEDYDVFVFACGDDTAITIPKHIKTIEPYAFYRCTKLKTVIFTDDSELTTIKSNALFDSKIESLSIPSSVTELDEGWCRGAKNITKIMVVPNNRRYKSIDDKFIIGKSSIDNENYDVFVFACRDVKTVNFQKTIKFIDKFAFDECEKLLDVEFPVDSEIQVIETNYFLSSNLRKLTIPPSVIELKEGCFKGERKITVMPNNKRYKSIDDKFIIGKSNIENEDYDVFVFACRDVNTIDLPKSIKVIESNAFYNCYALNLNIPKESELQIIKAKAFDYTNLKNIRHQVHLKKNLNGDFSVCSELQQLDNTEETEIKSIEDFLFDNQTSFTVPPHINKITCYSFAYSKTIKRVEIPKNSQLQVIEFYAFYRSSIKRITLPPHLKIIEEGAFSECYSLSKVEIPSDSELEIIESNAFSSSAIQKITIPASVIELKEGWCKDTSKLKFVSVSPNNKRYLSINNKFIVGKSSIEEEKYDVFVFACSNVKTVHIPKTIKTIESYAFYNCKKLVTVVFSVDSELQLIKEESFARSSISHIEFPIRLKVIGKNAFSWCRKLQKVEFNPDTELDIIEDSAFAYSYIEGIKIPDNLTTIKHDAFSNCEMLQKVEISPNSKLHKIEKNAFNYTLIKSISIPPHLTSIPEGCFCGSEELQTIEITNNSELQKIGKNAFNGTKIERITIPSSVTELEEGWYLGADSLEHVTVMQNNKHYVSIDDIFVAGKSNVDDEDYDKVVFVCRDVGIFCCAEEFTKIDPYVFNSSNQLDEVMFDSGSQFEIIERETFSYSTISKISLPVHLKKICTKAFDCCRYLHTVEVPSNSELQIIEPEAFHNTAIEALTVPPSLASIGRNAFADCTFLQRIDIPENSQLQTIGKDAFNRSIIRSLFIPAHLVNFCKESFYGCAYLEIIEIHENWSIKNINRDTFKLSNKEAIIMIPTKLKDCVKNVHSDYSHLPKIFE